MVLTSIIFNGEKERELEGRKRQMLVWFPALAGGGTEALYRGLSVLEASEARFVSEESGLASTKPCRGKNRERQRWIGTQSD